MSLVNDETVADNSSGRFAGDLTVRGDLIVEGSMGVTMRIQSIVMFANDISTTYQRLDWSDTDAISTTNFIQYEDETITWQGITMIQDDNANPGFYTLKVSKDTGSGFVEQDIADVTIFPFSTKELTFQPPTLNTHQEELFFTTFDSIQNDKLQIELKDFDSGGEEVSVIMFGFYTR